MSPVTAKPMPAIYLDCGTEDFIEMVAFKDDGEPNEGLVGRIANVLGLEKEPLFLLAHPEAGSLLNERREPAHINRDPDQVWRDFTGNKAMLARHQVKPNELKVLSQVNLLGKVAAPRQFLFILNAIRQAVDEEE